MDHILVAPHVIILGANENESAVDADSDQDLVAGTVEWFIVFAIDLEICGEREGCRV